MIRGLRQAPAHAAVAMLDAVAAWLHVPDQAELLAGPDSGGRVMSAVSAAVQVSAVPDGAPPGAADPRVAAAAELLAERRQPSMLSAAQLRGLLAIYERRLRGLLDVVGPAPCRSVQHLQALEDALKYRRARITDPCAGCDGVPDGRCEDHGRDVDLIGVYERTARRLLAGSTP